MPIKEPKYYRARIAVIVKDMPMLNKEQRPLYRNGFIPGSEINEFEKEVNELAKETSNEPLSFAEITSFSTWFNMHPEKMAGKEVQTTSLAFPLKLQGNKNDIQDMIKRTFAVPGKNIALAKAKAKALKIRLGLLELNGLGAVKKLGRSGKYIETTRFNHKAVLKSFGKWLDNKGIDWELSRAYSTSSAYVSFYYGNGEYKIRFANHSKAITSEYDLEKFDLTLYDDKTFSLDIDTSFGLKTKDLIEIINISNKYSQLDNKKIFSSESLIKNDKNLLNEHYYNSKLFKELNLQNDDYDLLKYFLIQIAQFSFKNNEEYKKHKEDEKNINEAKTKELLFKRNINGVIIEVKGKSWAGHFFPELIIEFEENYKGKGKKRIRKKILDTIKYALFNNYKSKKITKEEFIREIKELTK